MDALATFDPALIALIAALIGLVAFVSTLIQSFRQRRLLKRYQHLLNGRADLDLEGLLLAQAGEIQSQGQQIAELNKQVQTLTTNVQVHIQKTAIIRFNAFPDTGSDLSFAIALLDAHHNGMVISNLYGRTESRVYAKPISNGASTYPLSTEEKQVIAKALERSEA